MLLPAAVYPFALCCVHAAPKQICLQELESYATSIAEDAQALEEAAQETLVARSSGPPPSPPSDSAAHAGEARTRRAVAYRLGKKRLLAALG